MVRFRGSARLRRRNPLDRKIPGVLIRPDRDEPKPAGYELSSWSGASRRHCRLTSGDGVALCGRSPGPLVALSRRRQQGKDRPLCQTCKNKMTEREIELP